MLIKSLDEGSYKVLERYLKKNYETMIVYHNRGQEDELVTMAAVGVIAGWEISE